MKRSLCKIAGFGGGEDSSGLVFFHPIKLT